MINYHFYGLCTLVTSSDFTQCSRACKLWSSSRVTKFRISAFIQFSEIDPFNFTVPMKIDAFNSTFLMKSDRLNVIVPMKIDPFKFYCLYENRRF